MAPLNVMLVGATGTIGPALLSALTTSTDPTFNVSILTRANPGPEGRRPPPWADQTHKPLQALRGNDIPVLYTDYTLESLVAIFDTIHPDVIVSAMSARLTHLQTTLVDAAVAAGVKRFVASEFGTAPTASEPWLQRVEHFEGKRVVERYLREQSRAGKIEWTGLMTGLFVDWAVGAGYLGFDVKNRRARVYESRSGRFSEERKFSATTLGGIGNALAKIIGNDDAWDRCKDRIVFVRGMRVSYSDILAAMEEETGAEWERGPKVDMDAVWKAGASGLEGTRANFPMLVIGTLLEKGGVDYDANRTVDNDLMGFREETLEEMVRNVVRKSAA